MKEKFLNLKQKVVKGALTLQTAMLVAPLTASANTQIAVNSNTSMDDIIGRAIDVVLTLARYVGVILLIFGIYQLYMSFKDDNPDGKVKAITLLVTSIGLITIKSILVGMGIIA